MAGGRKGRGCEAPVADQQWYIRENAVAIVAEKNEKIARLRKQITLLEKRCLEYKRLWQRAEQAKPTEGS